MIWKTIDSPPRHWRSKAKALILLDHLVKNGAERVVADAQQRIHDITYLNSFKYVDSGLEHGGGGECSGGDNEPVWILGKLRARAIRRTESAAYASVALSLRDSNKSEADEEATLPPAKRFTACSPSHHN